MKKLFSFFFAFVALALLTISCSKENQEVAPKTAKATHNSSAYDYVGEQHNAGLDFYLERADFKNKIGEIEPQTIVFGETIGYNREESAKILSDPRVAEIIYSKAPRRP
ncbi:hypothetical protein [Hymenobacter cellulosilyticus]|uniref:Uncharacterized protein n=1 Tax=Hymenobacter cellulosilyticus TaxID=2932248 RepID=A0A8T9Q1M9_9BACT|nr:hypothetical protein [Hymenobacter cellulosilyticus]UOQ70812.1 hypothetical protein MUN79_19260 [Hymenobacter cellulosilyticus]